MRHLFIIIFIHLLIMHLEIQPRPGIFRRYYCSNDLKNYLSRMYGKNYKLLCKFLTTGSCSFSCSQETAKIIC